MLIIQSITGAEPVSLADAKVAARVDNDLGGNTSSLDAFITGAIATARRQAEHLTGRLYRGRVLRAQFADWTAAQCPIAVFSPTAVVITYWNGTAWAALNSTLFAFFPAGPGNTGTGLAHAIGSAWPTLGAIAGGPRIRVDLTAGPTGQEAEIPVDECVKLYIKAQVASWVDNGAALVNQALKPNPMLEFILDPEKLWC